MSEQALQGQVALVTGGARRIGRAIVKQLAAEGAAVFVNYRNSRADAESLQKELQAEGGRIQSWQADVTRREEVQRMIGGVLAEFGRLDILVNNAGAFQPVPFEQLTEDQWDAMLDANLKSQFLCAQAVVSVMRKQGSGRIINLASIGAFLPWPKYVHYCVSKAGVVMLTRALARALAPQILVNAVAPGTIEFPGEPPHEDFIRRVPLGRAGAPADIAGAVAYLAKADYVTGQVLVVDGGRSLT